MKPFMSTSMLTSIYTATTVKKHLPKQSRLERVMVTIMIVMLFITAIVCLWYLGSAFYHELAR